MKTHWRIANLHTGARCLVPADRQTADELARWKPGQTRSAKMNCPRNPKFNGLAHAIGGLAADNLDAFEGAGAHQVLKRLQIESGAGCDEIAIMRGKRPEIVRIPRSLAFDSMDEDEYQAVVKTVCRYLRDKYWPDVTVEQIVEMAQEWERQ
jgi:hypothetical protein